MDDTTTIDRFGGGWLQARAVVGACVLVASCGVAAGQSSVLELDAEGEGWAVVSTPEPGSDEAVLAEARQLLADGHPGRARKKLDTWIEANDRRSQPLLPAALLLRGDAWTADGDEYKALYDYERICREFPSSDVFVKANQRELEIATRYVNGLRRKTFGIRFESTKGIGEELLVRIQERLPGSRLAEQAAIELADFYYRQRDMKTASEMYAIFLTNYPNSEYRKLAMQRRVYANIAQFKGPEYDASGLVEAKFLIREFQDRFPIDAERTGLGDALAARLDESTAAQQLVSAQWHARTGDAVSARYALRRLVERFPRTVAAAEAVAMAEERGWSLEPRRGAVRPTRDAGPIGPEPMEATGDGEAAAEDEADAAAEAGGA